MYKVQWKSECWHLIVNSMENLTMYKKCKYYNKTYNNIWTTYFMLAFKYLASILVLFNIENLLG